MKSYELSDEEREHFRTHGYVHLRGVLSEDEVAGLSAVYDRFLRREIEVPGKDLNDMAGDYGRKPEDYRYVFQRAPGLGMTVRPSFRTAATDRD